MTTQTSAPAGSLSRATLALVPRRDDEAPLAAGAVCAHGAVAGALIASLAALDDVTLRQLRGVRVATAAGAAQTVVVTGAADLLPWRDGVRYLGQIVPGLYVPTTRTTSLPASLAAEALARHLPAALLEPLDRAPRSSLLLVPLRAGLPLSRAALAHLFAEVR